MCTQNQLGPSPVADAINGLCAPSFNMLIGDVLIDGGVCLASTPHNPSAGAVSLVSFRVRCDPRRVQSYRDQCLCCCSCRGQALGRYLGPQATKRQPALPTEPCAACPRSGWACWRVSCCWSCSSTPWLSIRLMAWSRPSTVCVARSPARLEARQRTCPWAAAHWLSPHTCIPVGPVSLLLGRGTCVRVAVCAPRVLMLCDRHVHVTCEQGRELRADRQLFRRDLPKRRCVAGPDGVVLSVPVDIHGSFIVCRRSFWQSVACQWAGRRVCERAEAWRGECRWPRYRRWPPAVHMPDRGCTLASRQKC